MQRALIRSILAIPLSLAGGWAMAQQRQFDGHWNVEATPEKGVCSRVHRYAVVIENGAVRKGAPSRASITGGLETGGRIQGSVQRNKTRVDVTGRLSGQSGSGNWVAVGRVNCSGRWRAERR